MYPFVFVLAGIGRVRRMHVPESHYQYRSGAILGQINNDAAGDFFDHELLQQVGWMFAHCSNG